MVAGEVRCGEKRHPLNFSLRAHYRNGLCLELDRLDIESGRSVGIALENYGDTNDEFALRALLEDLKEAHDAYFDTDSDHVEMLAAIEESALEEIGRGVADRMAQVLMAIEESALEEVGRELADRIAFDVAQRFKCGPSTEAVISNIAAYRIRQLRQKAGSPKAGTEAGTVKIKITEEDL